MEKKLVSWSGDLRIQRMQYIYSLAVNYLNDRTPENIRGAELKRYYDVERVKTMNDVMRVLFGSLQNRKQLPNVIGYHRAERKSKFDEIFMGYCVSKILTAYKDTDGLYERFCDCFDFRNKEKPNNLWRQYSQFVVSACKYMARFKDVDEFIRFVESYISDERLIDRLPEDLKRGIKGLGFALACDFLKESGFNDYAKPDTHTIEIFTALELAEDNEQAVVRAIREMAVETGETAFNVDRTFWLIASGDYFLHGKKIGRAGGKDEFIKITREACERLYGAKRNT